MPLPSINMLFLDTPLYERFPIDFNNAEYLYEILFYQSKLDAFCPFCDKHSTFKGTQSYPMAVGGVSTNKFADFGKWGQNVYNGWTAHKIHQVNLVCTREESHLVSSPFFSASCD